jgi:hypothetical protein
MQMNSSILALPDDLPVVMPLTAYGSIAHSLQQVEALRSRRSTSPELAQRTQQLRLWQSQRFRRTYADILQDAQMGPAALFFLTELYSDQEYSQRDAQFARIAGTLERLFPQSVVHTATLLAQLHALSETLDACMAMCWVHGLRGKATGLSDALPFDSSIGLTTYQQLWWSCLSHPGFQQARQEQLLATNELGRQLHKHTQVPGLRLMLKMMRAPASAAGLHDLQRFLERGFDTFGQLGRAGKVPMFLSTVTERESAWIANMADVGQTSANMGTSPSP